MDDALVSFRQEVDRENRRRPLRRRYSPALQQQAVEYCHPTTRRRRSDDRRGVGPLRHDAPAVDAGSRQAATVSADRRAQSGRGERHGGGRRPHHADGPFVEGLTVETAARLLTLLR